jgi:hypothetical protein
MRNVLSVIAGYALFAVTAVLWFSLTNHPPHRAASARFELATLAYGLLFALLGGFVTQWIASRDSMTVNFILAALMIVLALISSLTSGGAHWTQYMTMFIFAPASLVGGYSRFRSFRLNG